MTPKKSEPALTISLTNGSRLKAAWRVLAVVLFLPTAGYSLRLAVEPTPQTLRRKLYPATVDEHRFAQLQDCYRGTPWTLEEAYFTEDGQSALLKITQR